MEVSEKRRYNRIRKPKKKDVRPDVPVDTNEENGRKFTLARFLSDVEAHSLPEDKKTSSPKKIGNKPIKHNQQTSRGLFENVVLGRTTLKERPLSPNNLARLNEDIVALANEESDCDFFNDFEVHEDIEATHPDLFSTEKNRTTLPPSVAKSSDCIEVQQEEKLKSKNGNSSSVKMDLNTRDVCGQSNEYVFNQNEQPFTIEVDPHPEAARENTADDHDETYRVAKNLLEMLHKFNEEKKRGAQKEAVESPRKLQRKENPHALNRTRTKSGDSFNYFPWDKPNELNRPPDDGLSFFNHVVPPSDRIMPFLENFDNAPIIKRKQDPRTAYNIAIPPQRPSINFSHQYRDFSRAPPHFLHSTVHSDRSRFTEQSLHPRGAARFLQTSGAVHSASNRSTLHYEHHGRNPIRRNPYENNCHSSSTSEKNVKDRAFFLLDRDCQRDMTTTDSTMQHFMTRMRYGRCFDRPLSPRKY